MNGAAAETVTGALVQMICIHAHAAYGYNMVSALHSDDALGGLLFRSSVKMRGEDTYKTCS